MASLWPAKIPDALVAAILGAVTEHRRLNRASALVLADCLDECGDDRAPVVRGLAQALLVPADDAWRQAPRDVGTGFACLWSDHGRKRLQLAACAPQPASPPTRKTATITSWRESPTTAR